MSEDASHTATQLRGLTVAVTGSRRASELASLITSLGGQPYIAPTVGIEARQDISKEAESFTNRILSEGIDYAIFMTGPGVYSLMAAARNLGIEQKLVESLKRVTIVARSVKPLKALADHGLKTAMVPEENTAEGIAKALKNRSMTGKRVAVLWHGSYSPLLRDELQAAGADVFEYSTYAYSLELRESGAEILDAMGFHYISPDEAKVVKLMEDIKSGCIDAITFTSPPSVRNLFMIAGAHHLNESLLLSLKDVIVVAVGPSTRRALEENGVQVDVVPQAYKMGPMVKALSDYLNRADRPKRRIAA